MNIKIDVDLGAEGGRLGGMLKRAKLVKGWLNRFAYPTVIAKQRLRWQSEGASEGSGWAPLNPKYARRKLTMFRDAPGGGRKILIATGKLVDSVTGDNTESHYKLVTDNRLETGTIVKYAGWVNEKRDFVTLSADTVQELKDSLLDYLQSGKE